MATLKKSPVDLSILCAALLAPVCAQAAQQPDVLVVLVDQWSPRDTPRWGTIAKTPNLDAVADQGMRFYSAYCASPMCMPSRVALLTGQFPHNTQLWSNTMEYTPQIEQARLFADMKQAGYTTAQVGKIHWVSGNAWKRNTPSETITDFYNRIGADHVDNLPSPFSTPNDKGPYSEYLKSIGKFDAVAADMTERIRGDNWTVRASACSAEEHNEMFVAKRAIEYLEKQPTDKPLFLVVSFFGPHNPVDAPEPYASMYDPADVELHPNVKFPVGSGGRKYGEQQLRAIKANYLGKISHIDECAGRVFEALKKRGNWDNTLVIFAADHGEFMGSHGSMTKGQMFEESAGIPMWIRPPKGQAVAAKESDIPVNMIDIYATVVEAGGGTVTPQRQSNSLWPIVRGEVKDDGSQVTFSEIDQKFLSYMVRKGDFKWFRAGTREYLFNLKDDPFEMKNLAADPAHAEKARELRDTYFEWLITTQLHYGKGYIPRGTREAMKAAEEAKAKAGKKQG